MSWLWLLMLGVARGLGTDIELMWYRLEFFTSCQTLKMMTLVWVTKVNGRCSETEDIAHPVLLFPKAWKTTISEHLLPIHIIANNSNNNNIKIILIFQMKTCDSSSLKWIFRIIQSPYSPSVSSSVTSQFWYSAIYGSNNKVNHHNTLSINY